MGKSFRTVLFLVASVTAFACSKKGQDAPAPTVLQGNWQSDSAPSPKPGGGSAPFFMKIRADGVDLVARIKAGSGKLTGEKPDSQELVTLSYARVRSQLRILNEQGKALLTFKIVSIDSQNMVLQPLENNPTNGVIRLRKIADDEFEKLVSSQANSEKKEFQLSYQTKSMNVTRTQQNLKEHRQALPGETYENSSCSYEPESGKLIAKMRQIRRVGNGQIQEVGGFRITVTAKTDFDLSKPEESKSAGELRSDVEIHASRVNWKLAKEATSGNCAEHWQRSQDSVELDLSCQKVIAQGEADKTAVKGLESAPLQETAVFKFHIKCDPRVAGAK